MSTSTKGTALVTGASAGIGAVYADRLARRGFNLIVVARNRERLNQLAKRIADDTGRTVEVVVADLNNKADVARVETLLRTDASITALVNNAGLGATEPLLNSNIDQVDDLITINVSALTRLTYAAAPEFVARGGGTIINISSIVAIAPEMLNGVYSASKAFVLALSRSLDHELKNKNVRVQAVLPGVTATDFWDAAGKSIDHYPSQAIMSAEAMVDAALAGLDMGELVTIPSLPEVADLQSYEAARQKLIPNLSRNTPAARYRTSVAA